MVSAKSPLFHALVALKLLVLLISRLVACSARIVVDTHTDRQTDRQTHTQTQYCNPRCACTLRVKNPGGNTEVLFTVGFLALFSPITCVYVYGDWQSSRCVDWSITATCTCMYMYMYIQLACLISLQERSHEVVAVKDQEIAVQERALSKAEQRVKSLAKECEALKGRLEGCTEQILRMQVDNTLRVNVSCYANNVLIMQNTLHAYSFSKHL